MTSSNYSFSTPFGPGIDSSNNTSASLYFGNFDFTTNSSGAITAWSFDVYQQFGEISFSEDAITLDSGAICKPDGNGCEGGDTIYWICEGDPCGVGSSDGVASLVATPEPRSLLLLGTGLLGLIPFIRRA